MRPICRFSTTACSMLAALVLAAAPAQATTIALQPGGALGKDAQLSDGGNAAANFGTDSRVITNWAGNLLAIGLLEFDLSAIPVGATITSATLSLYHELNTQFTPAVYNAFRVTSAWSESTVTFNTAPTFDPVAVSSLTFSGAAGVFRDWSVTSVVQGWVSGTFANHGLWIEEVPVGGTATAYFASSDAADSSWHPTLTVDFTADATVPEPSTLVLFASGAAFVALRYRRR